MDETTKALKTLVEGSKCYRVILSTKTEVKCDQNEVQRIVEGIGTGAIIKLKQGLINPSFIVAVVEDDERRKDYVEDLQTAAKRNRDDVQFEGGKNQKSLPVLRPLRDIFAGTPLKAQLEDGIKKLKEHNG